MTSRSSSRNPPTQASCRPAGISGDAGHVRITKSISHSSESTSAVRSTASMDSLSLTEAKLTIDPTPENIATIRELIMLYDKQHEAVELNLPREQGRLDVLWTAAVYDIADDATKRECRDALEGRQYLLQRDREEMRRLWNAKKHLEFVLELSREPERFRGKMKSILSH
jgi:hypothetical protein